MKILVYAFDPVGESAYLPHNCPPQSVVYTGTHDTPTFVQWLFEEASPDERDYASDYLRLRPDEGFGWGAVCGAGGVTRPAGAHPAPRQPAVVPQPSQKGVYRPSRPRSQPLGGWRVTEASRLRVTFSPTQATAVRRAPRARRAAVFRFFTA